MAEKIYTIAEMSSKSYWFKAKIPELPENICCQGCECIVPELDSLYCGHWFCRVCLKGIHVKNKSNTYKCIFCHKNNSVCMTTSLNKRDFQNRRAACPNEGCNFKGTIRDVKKHTPFCAEDTLISCSGCAIKLKRSLIAEHRSNCQQSEALSSQHDATKNKSITAEM